MRLKYAEDFYIRALLKKVKLEEVMTTPAVSIDVESPFREVVKLLHEKRFRHLPVINSRKQVVGIISQRDLYKTQPPHKNEDGVWVYDLEMIDGYILRNVMVPEPFTLKKTALLAEAIEAMVRNKYGCVPVIEEDGRLCGIITKFDILRIAFEILQEG